MLYHVICLQNTPPATIDEQQECLEARTVCWRLRPRRKRTTLTLDDDDDDADDEATPTAASAGVSG